MEPGSPISLQTHDFPTFLEVSADVDGVAESRARHRVTALASQ